MNTSTVELARAHRVWFDKDNLWVQLTDGRQVGVPLAYFPRLAGATARQRKHFVMSGGGTGLHWEEIDEDISVPGLLGIHTAHPMATAELRSGQTNATR